MQISMAKNVRMMTYETSTRNISFMAGFDSTTNSTAPQALNDSHSDTNLGEKKNNGHVNRLKSAVRYA